MTVTTSFFTSEEFEAMDNEIVNACEAYINQLEIETQCLKIYLGE